MEYSIAVITNKLIEFRQWETDCRIIRDDNKLNLEYKFYSNGIKYIAVSRPTHVCGYIFNGIIIPKCVNTGTDNHTEIMNLIDMCFTPK